MRLLCLLTVLTVSATSQAAVITFDGITLGGIGGPATFSEAGFDYAITNGFGGIESGLDREYERLAGTSGTLTITKTGGGLFTFTSVDLQLEYGSAANVTVQGFLAGNPVGSDSLLVSSSAYGTFSPTVLFGTNVDTLVILAQRDGSAGAAVNNFNLGSAAEIPEPATLAVFGGLALAGLAGYRRRKTKTVA